MFNKKPSDNSKLNFRTILFRGVLYMIIIPTVIMLVIFGIFYTKSTIDDHIAQSHMQSYLKRKYGQEFIVENYRIEGAGLGVDGVAKAEAYAKSDHTIRFMVKGFPGDSPYSNNYWDGYPDMMWAKHLKKDIDPMIKNVFGADTSLASIEVYSIPAVNQRIGKEIPLYRDAFQRFGKDIHVAVRIKSRVVHNDVAAQIYQIIFKLRELGVSLSINYENPMVYVALVEETSIRGIHSPQDVGKYIEMKEKKL